MICRFCSQWNPGGAVRCAFCRNPPDAETDVTSAGRPVLSQQQVDQIASAGRTRGGRPGAGYSTGHGVEDAIREWFDVLASHRQLQGFMIAVVVALFIVFARLC